MAFVLHIVECGRDRYLLGPLDNKGSCAMTRELGYLSRALFETFTGIIVQRGSGICSVVSLVSSLMCRG